MCISSVRSNQLLSIQDLYITFLPYESIVLTGVDKGSSPTKCSTLVTTKDSSLPDRHLPSIVIIRREPLRCFSQMVYHKKKFQSKIVPQTGQQAFRNSSIGMALDLDDASVNYEQLPQAIGYLLVGIIAFFWVFCTRGLFKKQISLQRRLFAFIFLSCFTRGIQAGIFSQICFKSTDDVAYSMCDYFHRTSQMLDLFSSEFNFLVFFVLSCFWAEQYFTVKTSINMTSTDQVDGTHPNNIEFKSKRRLISIVFWAVAGILTAIIVIISLLIYVLPHSAMYYRGDVFLSVRLVVRIITSVLICVLLIFFGWKLYRIHKKQSEASLRNNKKLAYITIYTTSCYMIFVVYNIATFIAKLAMQDEFYSWPYLFIFQIALSYLEISSHMVLLVLLVPDTVYQFLAKCALEIKRLCNKETNQNVRYDVHNLASLDYGYYSDEVNYYTQNHVDDYETNDTDYYQMPVHIDEY